jgi:hypothetical protein
LRRPNLELHIEELVLHNFAPGERYTIADAVERELARLLATDMNWLPHELIARSGLARVDTGDFQVSAGAGAHHVGVQIAQAVHGGITK